jgi:hypothetical protein
LYNENITYRDLNKLYFERRAFTNQMEKFLGKEFKKYLIARKLIQ